MKITCLVSINHNYIYNYKELNISNDFSYDAEVFIASAKYLVKERLDLMPNLKFIQLVDAGYDSVDLNYLKERNIILSNAKGVFSKAIAEDVLCKILLYTTNALKYYQAQLKHQYKRNGSHHLLSDYTVGVLGTGDIAKEIVNLLKPFGPKMIGYKRKKIDYLDGYRRIYYQDEFKEFLNETDILIISANLNESTYHLINDKTMYYLKKGSSIINIARGKIIDENALVEALDNNYLDYVALDVVENEPLDPSSKLYDYDNVIITPHSSGDAISNEKLLIDLIRNNIYNYQNNKIIYNLVENN